MNAFNLVWNGLFWRVLVGAYCEGRVYSIFIRLIKFFTLINGRMCSHRNCPVCSLKPIICLSSGRLLASNRLSGNGVYIVRTATWQRGTHKMCLWKSIPRYRLADQSCREHRRFHRQPIVVEPWRSGAIGKGDQAEMFDYGCVLPVESYLARSCEEYWSRSFPLSVTQQWELCATSVMSVTEELLVIINEFSWTRLTLQLSN